jgi:predicted LPLAT superfamily acyltransferase
MTAPTQAPRPTAAQASAHASTRHWSDMGETTFALGIWLMYAIYRVFGRWPFLVCLYPVAAVHWLLRPSLRAASLQYLQRVEAATGAIGHAPGARDTFRHITLFGETMLDKLLAVSGRYQSAAVRAEGRETVLAASASKRGGVIVTAHIGCLELSRYMGEMRGALRLNILVHTRHAAQFNRILNRLNPDNPVRLIEVTDFDAATAMLLADKVALGEFVVIAGDRVPVDSAKTVEAEFLGHLAPFPVGPYVLAALLKCPMYMMGCIHDQSSYTVHFAQITERVDLPRGRREEALATYARSFADALTLLLRRSPFDWFNFFSFWDQRVSLAFERHNPVENVSKDRP